MKLFVSKFQTASTLLFILLFIILNISTLYDFGIADIPVYAGFPMVFYRVTAGEISCIEEYETCRQGFIVVGFLVDLLCLILGTLMVYKSTGYLSKRFF